MVELCSLGLDALGLFDLDLDLLYDGDLERPIFSDRIKRLQLFYASGAAELLPLSGKSICDWKCRRKIIPLAVLDASFRQLSSQTAAFQEAA